MRRLITAVTEWFEAKAELLREEAASLTLGVYARGLKDGLEDGCCGCDVFDDADETD
jgi:hypothetical protein